MPPKAAISALLLGLLVGMSGCASPNKANIELRKKNQQLDSRIAQLQTELEAAQARITGLERHSTSVPSLPQSQLDRMFTVQSLKLTRLTGGADLDPNRPGDEGIRIDLEPLDQNGDPIKATGNVTVEAFDLAGNSPLKIGQWQFSPDQLKSAWRSLGPVHEFVLECPWQGVVPAHSDLTIKVDFTDVLTQRMFSLTQAIKINLPASTTRPATRAN